MYCVKCGVRLADTEKKCPLCETEVYHPEIRREPAETLYPVDRMPKTVNRRAVLGGAIIILFLIPLVITLFSDLFPDGRIDWFGYVGGGLLLSYLMFILPLWFKKPNPVIFIPCDFAAILLYFLYVNLATGGTWFLTLALPVTVGSAIITCTLVTILHYVKRGRLYTVGGSVIALGLLILLIEHLIEVTFGVPFVGWSIYPLIPLALLGGLLIYLAINHIARAKVERKLFF